MFDYLITAAKAYWNATAAADADTAVAAEHQPQNEFEAAAATKPTEEREFATATTTIETQPDFKGHHGNELRWADAAVLAKALRDHVIDIPGVVAQYEFVTVPIKCGMPYMLRIKVMGAAAPAISWGVLLANGPETPTTTDPFQLIKTYNNNTGSFFWKATDHVAEKRTVDKIIAERARLANIVITAPNLILAMAAPVPT